jgi:uncharacterized coiled-coil DUF342 family protein
MADRVKMALRTYQMYEQGAYDGKITGKIKKQISKVQQIAEALDHTPTQKGDNDSLMAQIAALRNEVREIREQLMPTIQSLTKTIETLSTKRN